MTKKKISGQTITIIVLVILLILTAAFGGVYAYYSTKSARVSGRITLTALSINFEEFTEHEGYGKTEMFLSNTDLILPNEQLGNEDALVIKNSSDVEVYVVVVYTIRIQKCEKKVSDTGKVTYTPTDEVIQDDFACPFLDFGEKYTRADGSVMNEASSYFYAKYERPDAEGPTKRFHCILTKQPTVAEELTIVGKQDLRLHRDLTGGEDNKYMGTSISFIMQAFAIGAASFDFETAEGNANSIMDAIYATNAEDMDLLYTISQEVRR